MTPMMISHVHIPAEPVIISGLRPTLSIKQIAGIVVATLIMPITPEASSEIVLPVRPRDWNMIDA